MTISIDNKKIKTDKATARLLLGAVNDSINLCGNDFSSYTRELKKIQKAIYNELTK